MLPATPHRTADRRLVAPTPMIALVIVWVVEMGALAAMAIVYRTTDAAVSAANPCGGLRWMIRRPSVRMMRQPPEYVPSEMAAAAARMTHCGIGSSAARKPPV